MAHRLIIRPGAIGDFILSLPAMERLRTDYLEIWAGTQNLPLARFAARTRSIASTGLDMLEIDPPAGLVQELRGFDSIVSWYGSARPEFRETVETLGLRFQFLTAIPPENCRMHAADFYLDRKSTRLNSSHITISYAVFCLKKKKKQKRQQNNHKQTNPDSIISNQHIHC